ncbi:hypothetical protein PMN64_41885 [Bradyrhizobium sp. UFLA01-814]|uniref:hypothetical protein n=1 Tax=Bradyrhizobium sp. UFLA01-814 TaxID=3023480 RepID=UPI00398B0572
MQHFADRIFAERGVRLGRAAMIQPRLDDAVWTGIGAVGTTVLGIYLFAGPQIDKAIGMLIAEQLTPAAVELALDIRREIEARYEEADQLRCRAIERAQIEADLAQRRFMLVDNNNRLVADTLEGEWNDKLRVLAKAREDRERARERDQLVLDE